VKVKRTGRSKTTLISGAKTKKKAVKSKKLTKSPSLKRSNTIAKTEATNLELRHYEPNAFAALNDADAVAEAWDILGDEEFLLDESLWASLYNKIKLQLLTASYAFRPAAEGDSLTPYAVVPMPTLRSGYEPGYLNAGHYTLIRPELPGIVFDLKISANDVSLIMDWHLKGKNSSKCSGHMALYIDGDLAEATNLVESRAHLDITRDDIGAFTFYFLDADTGRQIKVLDLEL